MALQSVTSLFRFPLHFSSCALPCSTLRFASQRFKLVSISVSHSYLLFLLFVYVVVFVAGLYKLLIGRCCGQFVYVYSQNNRQLIKTIAKKKKKKKTRAFLAQFPLTLLLLLLQLLINLPRLKCMRKSRDAIVPPPPLLIPSTTLTIALTLISDSYATLATGLL